MVTPPTRVLCIDDDPLALDQLRAILDKVDAPIACAYFGSPARALEAQRDNPAELVISDLRLGATTGLKLISQMRRFAPNAVYMLLSGEADLESALTAVNEAGVFRFFTKPARQNEFQRGVTEAIQYYNLQKQQAVNGATLDTLEQMNTAVASIESNGRIIFANAPATEIFEQADHFSVSHDGFLRSVDTRETMRFLRFLEEASSPKTRNSRIVFRFCAADSFDPIAVSAIWYAETPTRPAHFNLIIADPGRKDVASPERIAAALALTPSEARIVHGLIEQGSVDEAALSAGVSISTARTYLKNVFSKTGVSKQGELVRLAILTAA